MERAKAFKRKMLLWTNNWFQEEQEPAKQFRLDAMGITRLLQATGFRGRFVDVGWGPNEIPAVPGVLPNCTECQVIVTCPRSGLRIELNAPSSSCECPSSDSGVGHSWTACKKAGEQMREATDSTVIIPDDDIAKTVSQVIGGLLHVMSMFPDLNDNNMETLTAESTLCSKTAIQHQKPGKSASNCSSNAKTPATTLAGNTPNTPRIPKTSPRNEKSVVSGRYGSLDTLIASGSNFSDDIPEPGQLTPKESRYSQPETYMADDVDLNATIVEGPESRNKKFISNSSPAVYCTEQFQRSSTFAFEGEERDSTKKQDSRRMLLRSNTYVSDGFAIDAEDEPRKGPPPRRTPSPMVPVVSQSAILSKLQDLQSTVGDLIFMVTGNEKNRANIDDVSDTSNAVVADAVKVMTDDTRSIRSLSDFGGVRNSTRLTTQSRSIPRPNIRKRTTTSPGSASPTTSKQGVIASGGRRKSLSTTTLLTTETAGKTLSTTPKLGCHSRPVPQSNLRKMFTSPFSKTNISGLKCKEKISPASTMQSVAPHRKYANIQSSIPKAGVFQK